MFDHLCQRSTVCAERKVSLDFLEQQKGEDALKNVDEHDRLVVAVKPRA